MDPNISLITLGVDELDRAIRFYREGLGFPLQDRENDSEGGFFPLKAVAVALSERPACRDATAPDDGTGFPGVTIPHNLSTTDEVDAILEQAEVTGGTLVKPAADTFWGWLFKENPTDSVA